MHPVPSSVKVPAQINCRFLQASYCSSVRLGVVKLKKHGPGVDLSEFNVIVIQRNKEEAANREWRRSKIC